NTFLREVFTESRGRPRSWREDTALCRRGATARYKLPECPFNQRGTIIAGAPSHWAFPPRPDAVWRSYLEKTSYSSSSKYSPLCACGLHLKRADSECR